MHAPFAAITVVPLAANPDELLVAPPLQHKRWLCYFALILADFTAIFIGFAAAGQLITGSAATAHSMLYAELAIPFYLIVAGYDGAYSLGVLQDAWRGIAPSLLALVIALAATVFVQFMVRPGEGISRLAFNSGAFATMLLIPLGRLLMRRFVRWHCGETVINELVIEDGGPHLTLPGAIRINAAGMGLQPNLNDPNALHRIGLVLRNVDRVVVSCPPARRADWALMLKGANIDGEVLDDEVVRLGAQGARVAGQNGLLLVSAGPLRLRDRAVKRLFDVAFAGSAVLVLSPLLLVVAAAVKAHDGGPIFFKQRRIGRGNRFFHVYKFRSMTHALCDTDGGISAFRGDQRITPIGRLLRKSSIDELPQLFNVLLGDMSIVGPRPHATGSLAGQKLFWEIDSRYWQRHCLKPGLSGLAQVRGYRGATDHESDLINRLQADLEYLEGWTITRDIQIIFLTLRVLVHDRAF